MYLQVVFKALFMSAVFSACEGIKQMTKDFSGCDLPFKIPINYNYVYEISNNYSTSFVTIQGSIFEVKAPFKNGGNQTVTLDKCMDFDLKILSENNNEDEERIHYKCKPCDLPTDPPTDPPTDRKGLFIGIGVVLVCLLPVIVIVCLKVKSMRYKGVEQDNDDDSRPTAHDDTCV